MDSIDKLLAEIKAEYGIQKPEQQQPPPVAKPINQPQPKSASLIDNLLAEVKADFEQKDLAREMQRQQELQQEQIGQEKLRAKKQEAVKKQAKDWLAKLDPLSSEGLWFERFAETYPSKLEAAVEYLQASE